MARIEPINPHHASDALKAAFEQHIAYYGGRITHMKATLAHSPLAFGVYMQWHPLYEEVKKIVGERLAYLYSHAVSQASNCPLCTTFFRRIILDNGEQPDALQLNASEQRLLNFGSEIARQKGYLAEDTYQAIARDYNSEQIVVLVAFAGQMIATNVFNNALEVTIDEYLTPYLPLTPTPHGQ